MVSEPIFPKDAPGRSAELLSSALARVEHLLGEAPVESGVAHPAEAILEEHLSAAGNAVGGVLTEVFHTLRAPAARADLLLLLGRVLGHWGRIPEWGYDLAATALESPELLVRDAAVRVLEVWGGPRAVSLLSVHIDTGAEVSWLAEYVRAILPSLSASSA